MFSDLLYPDNQERGQRAAELSNDCENFASELHGQKDAIEGAMKALDEAYQRAFGSFGNPQFDRKDVQLAQSWVLQVPAPVAGIATSVFASRALQQAFTRYLVAQGRIGEAAFARLVGLPKWFRFGKFAGSVGAAMAATLIIQLGIDAVDGAVQRSQLRDAIKDMATPRFRLKRAIDMNRELLSSINGFATAYDVQAKFLASMDILTQEQKKAMLDKFTSTYIAETNTRLGKITDQSILDTLSRLDKDRQSWTSEDAAPDTSPEPMDP